MNLKINTQPTLNNFYKPLPMRKSSSLSFRGNTKIFALTDSHLRCRDKSKLLSRIIEESKHNDNILVLDGGDIFKGLYPNTVEIENYIKFKKLAPNVEVIINVGNNDPGYDRENFEFFKKSVKKLEENGIHVVSANTWEKETDKRVDGIKPYKIINRDGDKLLVIGFSIDTFTTTVPEMKSENPKKALNELKDIIMAEKPDGLIILNHDYFDQSQELLEFAEKKGLNVDLIVGGHQHFPYYDHPKILYPDLYGKSMLELSLNIDNKKLSRPHNLSLDKVILSKKLNLHKQLEESLNKAENEEGFNQEIADSIIGLTAPVNQKFSKPTDFGTFFADGMRNLANTDIAIFSNGFINEDLDHHPGNKVKMFDILKSISPGPSRVEVASLTPGTLKEMFENALKDQLNGDQNKKYIQYSGNIKVVRRMGCDKEQDKKIENKVVQIFVNNKPLLDEETGKPLNRGQKFTCAIDSYIGSGKQGYTMLSKLPRKRVYLDGQDVSMQTVLIKSLVKLAKEHPDIKEYPTAKMISLWSDNNTFDEMAITSLALQS